MTAPVRLQLSRAKGFRLQALSLATNGLPAVKVDRSTRFGNPWTVRHGAWWFVDGPGTPIGGIRCGNEEGARLVAVDCFRRAKDPERYGLARLLRGWNLACWCGPDEICHGDVWLELANQK